MTDRNFDDISAHFAQKIYGGLKGKIRLAVLRRDLQTWLAAWQAQYPSRACRVLDIGAGLGQLAIELAVAGHEVTVNDVSANMLTSARQAAQAQGVANAISWYTCAYQDLAVRLREADTPPFDLILCHAVLEWLDQPQNVLAFVDDWLVADGALSLCFYNPASFVYRNLIMGNFNLLNNADFQADSGSLTPNHPVELAQVQDWLDALGYTVVQSSGLRVFHDYAALKRGGHANPEAVIEMELKYSTQAPYKWLGRYIHLLAQKPSQF
ncbi:methyltransferase [Moraxella atlantae]|uniref:tRNA 5-carboxymethoxyuridine methyltransferase n=1 Tax=Faucicola atlantae TaxID=34059 RepID=A0A378Q4Z0_9GAMM|nr:methyltransferase [Moraxella atlantae]OPH36325.1 SAM-dependent methyltransferase [Moraxella atlantae]STY95596.1 putative S-adenosyl-L-methionine-dependent methyltransferase [Moraxella atlantae]